MPHISRKPLRPETEKKIKDSLLALIAKKRSGDAKRILGQLLTKTEQLMIAKRLAIIFMLYGGASSYAIARTLVISPSTVARISEEYENGSFSHVTTLFEKEKEREKFITTLETIFRGGLPFRTGTSRHRWPQK